MTATPAQQVEELARKVALLRLQMADVKHAYAQAEQHFALKYAAVIDRKAQTAVALQSAEQDLRAAAEIEFKVTGEKQVCPGVSIRNVQKVEYEITAALAWARKSGLALKLDTKGFEALAKVSAGQPDGPPATVTVESRAVISETLAELLGVTREAEPDPEPLTDARD